MNGAQKAWRGLVTTLKAAALRWSAGPFWTWSRGLGRTTIDYRSAVGDGTGNSAVVACVDAVCRSFLEAPLRVRRYRRNGDLEPQARHPLPALVRRPNPFYAGRTLWRATLADRILSGNAYWFKVRSAAGLPVELWWIPSTLVTPRAGESSRNWITHYEYQIGGEKIDIRPADIVHFRHRLDPREPIKGAPPLASLYREVFTDDEAANYAASMLRNMGVPGLIVRPKTPEDIIGDDQAAELKTEINQRTGGIIGGQTLVARTPLDIDVLGFSPEQMQTRDLRRVPEERIAAVIGVPAVLVGLGAGLERSTYANYSEAREAFYEEHLIPLGMDLAEELMLQLMPDFDDPARVELDFDTSDIRVLQEDMNNLTTRLVAQLSAGGITVDEFRMELGYSTLGEQMAGALGEGQEGVAAADIGKVLYLPSNVTVTRVGDLGAEAPEPEMPALLPPGLADEGGEDEEQPTELRRVAGMIAREMKRLELPDSRRLGSARPDGPANGNGHKTPALIGEG